MSYLSLFERASAHLSAHGIQPDFRRGRPLTRVAISKLVAKLDSPFPTELADLYADLGNSAMYSWDHPSDSQLGGFFELPRLQDAVDSKIRGRTFRVEWNQNYPFNGVNDVSLAKKTAQRMRKWVPVDRHGNGDHFALDLATEPPTVVFDQHDWFDGGTGFNGQIVGASLYEFLETWSNACFQHPQHGYWPPVLRPSGVGIDWDSSKFSQEYRIPLKNAASGGVRA